MIGDDPRKKPGRRARRRGNGVAMLAVASAGALALTLGARPDAADAALFAPQAACGSSGWLKVSLPSGFVAQSLAVDVAPGRQRLYAGMYGAVGQAIVGASVHAIDLNALTTVPVGAFDANTMKVLGLAVRPDTGRLAAGLSTGGVVHADPDGVLGATLLPGRTVRAVEAADGTTFAGTRDQFDDTTLATEAKRAGIWRQRGDEPWTSLTGDVQRFDGYFWDLALDRNGRLWASMDGNGLFSIAAAASDTPGAWTPVGDPAMRSRTAQAIAIDPADPQIVYAGLRAPFDNPGTDTPGSYGLRISRDGGVTFTGYPTDLQTGEVAGGGSPFRAWQVVGLAAGPGGGWIFASAWGLGIFASSNAGAEWHLLRLPPGMRADGMTSAFPIEPYINVMATARINGTCDLLYVGGKDGLWARNIADIAAEMAHRLYLPSALGAPWDIRWPPAAADERRRTR